MTTAERPAAASVPAEPGGDPDLWFVLPPGFFEVRLDEPAQDRMLRMADAVDPMFPGRRPSRS
ncbi:hypothetical protein NKH77_32185 [Streptomyces sp. M19]